MRSPNFWGMAVRTPAGEVDLRAERFRSVTRRSRLFRLPIIRGALSLGETLWLGMKALTVSTNIALGEEEELSKKEIAGTLIFALVLGFGLFLVAPVLGTKGLGSLDRQQHREPRHLQPRGGCDQDRDLRRLPGGDHLLEQGHQALFRLPRRGAQGDQGLRAGRGTASPRTPASWTRATSAAGRASFSTCSCSPSWSSRCSASRGGSTCW